MLPDSVVLKIKIPKITVIYSTNEIKCSQKPIQDATKNSTHLSGWFISLTTLMTV